MLTSSSLTITGPSMNQEQPTPKAVTKWSALGYEQVPGLANRLISRYLRAQRRNMRRFFLERGFLDLAERMRQIKLSRQGMMAKNRMFQKVLDDYTKRTTPQPVAEAAPTVGGRNGEGMDLRATAERSGSMGQDHGGSVPEVARDDGAAGIVIEE